MTSLQRLRWLRYALGMWGALMAIATLTIATHPVGFLKAVSLTEDPAPIPALSADKKSLDVADFISNIPYAVLPKSVETLVPADLYRETLQQGQGLCSSKILGASYAFQQQGLPYQIIHVLHPKQFLQGVGHQLMRVPYQWNGEVRVGLVDVFDGGVILFNQIPADVHQLQRADFSSYLTVAPLHPSKNGISIVSGDEWRNAVIGYTTQAENNRYLAWLDRVSVKGAHSSGLNKNMLIFLAVLMGVHPMIHVPSLSAALGEQLGFWWLSQTALWVFRFSIPVLLVLLVLALRWRHRRD